MQTLAPRRDKWTPPVIKTVATENKGIAELAAAIRAYEQFLEQQDLLLKKKISNWRERLIEMLRGALLDRLLSDQLPANEVARLATEIAEHHRDPYSLVDEIVESFVCGEQANAHQGDAETRSKAK
jgi:LAO/AO transport system kinase